MPAWEAIVRAQGGDPRAPLPDAPVVEPVLADEDGFVTRMEARAVGVAAWRLGAGRARKEDPVSPVAGVRCLLKPGERAVKGQPVLELHTDDRSRLARAREALLGAVQIGSSPTLAAPLVLERVG